MTKQRLIPLPDALFEQYDLLECRCFMGLFPEIKRAWITVDHRLFLWNYEDETDFYSFDDQEQIIVSVALVRPKLGVFVDTIKHVLVVATPLEVFLLGVGYDGGKLAGMRGSGSGGEVTLYATQISVPADGVAMTSMCGTSDGRVFMSGNDGALYEFAYQSEDGWLTKKAKKINLTSTIASYFVPTFLTAKHDTAALSMVVDDQRRLLYVHLQDASVKVFWLGADGTEFVLTHHHKSIGTSAALLCPQFSEGPTEGGAKFEIASIHVIPLGESRTLGLVAITSGGCRLYFSTVKRTQRYYEASALAAQAAEQQPECFDLVHVRLPPDLQPAMVRSMQNFAPRQALNVHTAFYGNGTALLAHTWNEDHDSIVGVAPACAQILARISRQPRATLAEHASSARVEGRTWAIAEIDTVSAGGLNDLASVSSTPTRSFAVLTNAGVSILEKQRPVDMLRTLLARPALQDSQLKEFISAYGLSETCAMCFTILCADDYSHHTMSMQVLNAARRILFEYGGVPRCAEPVAAGFGAGDVAAGPTILLSGRHNGLAMYLARTLQAVWGRPATVSKTERVNVTRLHIGIPTSDLFDVQERLRRLQHFINNNQRFVPDQLNQMPVQPSDSARPSADIASCWQAESSSLAALYELLVRSSEVISFLCLLADFNLPVISDGIAEAQRTVLAGIPFNQLAASESGRVACKELILALINSQLKQHVSIDSVSDVLSKRCSTIFSSSDVALYKALEYLKLAAEAEEGAESVNLANEALALLTGIAATLSAKQVREICDQFEALGQYTAVASLSLACASESDPSNDALAFWSDGAPENDSREAVYRKRMECYKCVIELLDKRRTSVLNAKSLAQLPSNDALFQFALYDWLLDNDQSALLFQMRAPFVEKYLSLEPRTLEKCDMLWHFYIHEGQFGKASIVQRELAGSGRDDFEMDLARRIEYLSLSIGNSKIAIDAVRGGKARVTRELLSEEEEINELATLLRECEDQLEIAQVQMEIQQQLRALGGHETPARALDRRLFTVTELYERFAEPLRLWDAMLLILKASNHDDAQMVEEIWMTILRTVLDDAQRTGLMAVASKVSRLGARLYPSAAAFPLPLIAGVLVELAQERPDEYVRGYVGDTLVHANVPHWAVFEALNTLYIRNAAGAQKAMAEFLVREIAALTTAWMDSAHGASADSASPSPDEDSMPVMAVDEALSQYIINATLNNNVKLKNEIQRVQEHIRRIF
ncbi:hypothetical protein H4S07_002949 [Coemansia furcata]|uniref:Uncharacterized protein n=1 Tax=Coemansia furcata TaxID=417177 RepID=A0ACC1LJY3_9FUNG|nr:hypothetical protein H4S07_002949 [Coemansia furcata]